MRIHYKKERSRWLWHVDGIKGTFSTNRMGDGIYHTMGNHIAELLPPERFTVACSVDMSAKNKIRQYMNDIILPAFGQEQEEKAV